MSRLLIMAIALLISKQAVAANGSAVSVILNSQTLAKKPEAQCDCTPVPVDSLPKKPSPLQRLQKNKEKTPRFICDWTKVPVSSDKPYELCSAQPEKVEANYAACLDGHQELREGRRMHLLLQREQVRLLFTQELFYLTRQPVKSPSARKSWAAFIDRWKARQKIYADVLEFDRSKALGKDQCSLHAMLGLDCGNQPSLDIWLIKEKQANTLARNRNASRIVQRGLAYELLRAELMKLASEVHRPDVPASLEELNRKEMYDYLYNYYPELALDAGLEHLLLEHIVRLKLASQVTQKVLAEKEQVELPLGQLKGMVDESIRDATTDNPLSEQAQGEIERRFALAQDQILRRIDEELQKGRSDFDWLANQDYLLSARMQVSLNTKKRAEAGVLQTLLCHNVLMSEKRENRKTRFMVAGGIAALMTGVGALFDVGAVMGTTLAVSTVGLIGSTTAVDLYSASKQESRKKTMFLLQGADYSEYAEARDRLSSAIPWAVLNVAMSSPVFVLGKIAMAKEAAELAQDFERVRALDRYHKAVVATSLVTNLPITGVQVYDAVKAYEELKADLDKEDSQEDPHAPGASGF